MRNKSKSKKKAQPNLSKSSWLLPASLGMILLIGTVISLIQMRQTRNLQTKAESLTLDRKDCFVPADQLSISQQEQQVFDQINAHRAQYGLKNLVLSDSLVKAAKWMSRDMLAHKYLGHTDSLGRDVKTRLFDCGYSMFISIGENIDSGQDSATTIESWKHSPPQNANLLSDKFQEAGIALAADPANDSYYWTLDLGNISVNTTPTQAYPSQSPFPSSRLTPPLTPNPTPVLSGPIYGPTPTTYPSFTPNPLDMQLLINAKIIGIGTDGNRNPRFFARTVIVSIYDMKNQLVKQGFGYIVYDRTNVFRNIIHFGPVDNGTYSIKILTPHMLRAVVMPTFQVLDSAKLNNMPQVTLVQGDINDDNVVNITDYNLALGCFQDKKCQNKDLIDFNDDGIANIIDYNILLRNFRESQGD